MSLSTRSALHQVFTLFEESLVIPMAFIHPPTGVPIQDRTVLIQDTLCRLMYARVGSENKATKP